ncbi:Selenocysteine-specific elongation factor [Fukomys damarensis]|uniref:Selenocysteine-specific elongation factor n=1 Tax=Fukomys damarensis TaxID=885580 RepID=A0A091E1X5_FUKDA|nr:Selenocysteine-specific elongation factor [Fukomys damarensis]
MFACKATAMPVVSQSLRAQIIDLMMLVIDVTKGMQTQSAECLVIGQIACQKMIVVLNKIDLLAEGKRQAAIDKMTKKMQKTLENTKFRGAPIIPVAAKPGGPEAPEAEAPQGISELIELLKSQISIPTRDPSGSFLMSVDHCFSIKGQGTVMTGTILSGSISLGDSVEIPALKSGSETKLTILYVEQLFEGALSCCEVVKKVKSMQMFHTPVTSAMQGDRLGICVTQFDPKLLERGLVCTPESLHTIHAAILSVEKISYFRGPLQTKAKFHITVGHETVMGRLLFFSPAPDSFDQEPVLDSFDFSQEYLFQERYLCKDSMPAAADSDEASKQAGQAAEGHCPRQQWALVEFEKPVTCPRLSLVIGSRLDADIHANTCRLAFHGLLLHGLEDRSYAESVLPLLKVYKLKHKHGLVERSPADLASPAAGVMCQHLAPNPAPILLPSMALRPPQLPVSTGHAAAALARPGLALPAQWGKGSESKRRDVKAMDDYSVIGRSLFKKETNIQLFVGLKVHLSTGELGVIDSAFGQSGKFKVHIPGTHPIRDLVLSLHQKYQRQEGTCTTENQGTSVSFLPAARYLCLSPSPLREPLATSGSKGLQELLAKPHAQTKQPTEPLAKWLVEALWVLACDLCGSPCPLALGLVFFLQSRRPNRDESGWFLSPVRYLTISLAVYCLPFSDWDPANLVLLCMKCVTLGGLSPESKKILTMAVKKRGRAGHGEAAKQEEGAERPEPAQHVGLNLSFKRYIFDTHKRMVQSP